MAKVHELLGFLNQLAPFSYQESYDNSGHLAGDPNDEIKGVMIALDCIESVVQEAIENGCNVVLTHHPIVFKGLKSLTGKNYVERTVIKAIRNNVNLIAVHTNLDNMSQGVNKRICDKLKLGSTRILSPRESGLRKITVFIPESRLESVSAAMFSAGAGKIGNYDECGFSTIGTGTFRPLEGADPFSGEIGTRSADSEIRFEAVVPEAKVKQVVHAMLESHPYEEVAYDLIRLENTDHTVGAGMIGELELPVSLTAFLSMVKETFHCGAIRHTDAVGETVKKIAVCGGAGSFLLKDAIRAGADVFVTGDFKYHEFFDADGKIVIADIGHFESEQFTSELLAEEVKKKFSTFAVRLASVNTNPINYFI